jgi:hypothetical protein
MPHLPPLKSQTPQPKVKARRHPVPKPRPVKVTKRDPRRRGG